MKDQLCMLIRNQTGRKKELDLHNFEKKIQKRHIELQRLNLLIFESYRLFEDFINTSK